MGTCQWMSMEWLYLRAAKGGFLEVLQWAISNGCPYNRDKLCSYPKVKEWLASGVLSYSSTQSAYWKKDWFTSVSRGTSDDQQPLVLPTTVAPVRPTRRGAAIGRHSAEAALETSVAVCRSKDKYCCW